MARLKSNAASVEFRNVTKVYAKGKAPAVNDLSVLIEPGRLVTLLGPSGCGKTTTLRMIAGLELPTSGQILIGGADVTRLPATERDVSMVFQSYALFPHMTVRENVEYGLKFSGFSKKDVTEKAAAGLDLVGLSGFGDRLPSQLSGGQQQRVAVARALVLEPQVLLFDEPLSNLDAKLRRHVREEIREIQQSLGLTVVYVTHDQEEALAVSDEIIVMNNAVIAQIGTPRQLYDEPSNAFVADFIGEANLIDCEVLGIVDDRAKLRIGDVHLDVRADHAKPGAAKLAVRPGRLRILPQGHPNSLPGMLRKVTYVGSHLEFVVETEVGNVFVVSDNVDGAFEPGQPIGLGFADRGPVLVKS